MSDFEFVIPLNRNDLTHRSGVNNYVVDEVCPVRLLSGKLKGMCILYELIVIIWYDVLISK